MLQDALRCVNGWVGSGRDGAHPSETPLLTRTPPELTMGCGRNMLCRTAPHLHLVFSPPDPVRLHRCSHAPIDIVYCHGGIIVLAIFIESHIQAS